MKSLKYILGCGIVAVLSGCTGFLDKGPLTKPGTDTYYRTRPQIEAYVNGLYPSLPSYGNWGLGVLMEDKNSDNIVAGEHYDRRINGELHVNDTELEWKNLYERLRSVNMLFANFKVPQDQITEDVNSLLGEAYFMRAWWHFEGLKKFGNIVIADKIFDSQASLKELQLEQSTRGEVTDFILKDLQKAEEMLLPRSKYNGYRVNKEAAMALAVHVALYEGSWETYHKDDVFAAKVDNSKKYLEYSVAKAEALMNLGTVQLYTLPNDKSGTAYGSLFNSFDLSKMSEVLLWRKYSLEQAKINNISGLLASGAVADNPAGITKELVDTYLKTDGSFVDPNDAEYIKFENTFQNRDGRLLQTVMHEGCLFRDTTGGLSKPMHLQKYIVIPERKEVFGKATGQLAANGAPILIKDLPRAEQLKIQAVADFVRDSAANAKISAPKLISSGASLSLTGYHTRLGIYTTYRSGNSQQAFPLMRYAEVLLDYVEAKAILGSGNVDDAVLEKTLKLLQERAGVTYVKPTSLDPNFPNYGYELTPVMQAIRRERRAEFALQGKRLDDLLRWRSASVLKGHKFKGAWLADESLLYQSYSPKDQKELKKIHQLDDNHFLDPMKKTLAEGYNFDETRDYLLPIPGPQLVLQKTLKQNPGW